MNSLTIQKGSINFKSCHSLTEKGNTYYHTNSGLVSGGVLGAGITGTSLVSELVKKDKPRNFQGVLFIGALSAVIIALGALCDKLRNKDSQKYADEVAGGDLISMYERNKNIKISKKGNPYQENSWGCVTGAVLGLGLTLAIATVTLKAKLKGKATNQSFMETLKKLLFIDSGTEFSFLPLVTIPAAACAGFDYVANKEAKYRA